MDMDVIEPGVEHEGLATVIGRKATRTVCQCPLCNEKVGVPSSGIPVWHLIKEHKDVSVHDFKEKYKGKLPTWEEEYTEEELHIKKEKAAERQRARERKALVKERTRDGVFDRLAKMQRSAIRPMGDMSVEQYVEDVHTKMEEVMAAVPQWEKAGVLDSEKMFCSLYVTNGFNASAAFKATFPGEKRGVGNSTTPMLFLQRPSVQKLINLYMSSWIGVKANELNYRLTQTLFSMAFYDPAALILPDGTPRFNSWEEVPPELRCCIKKIRTVYYGKDADRAVLEVDLADRYEALKAVSRFMAVMRDGINETTAKANSAMTPETELMLRSVLDGGRKVARKKGTAAVSDAPEADSDALVPEVLG